ncbi:MAG: hypothetical protein R3E48_23295 [Burkholderiaceae bacterium]
MLRSLVIQPGHHSFHGDVRAHLLIGLGEAIFGGAPKTMIISELGLPTGSTTITLPGMGPGGSEACADPAPRRGGGCDRHDHDREPGGILPVPRERRPRAARAVADSHKAALSVGISLNHIWVIVWFTAGIVALVTGIMWGARSDTSSALQIIAPQGAAGADPWLHIDPGAIVGGLIIGIGEKLGELHLAPMILGSMGKGVESWIAYFIALGFLMFRPQGLFAHDHRADLGVRRQ